ncbi:hypothetical protein KCH_31950 [Kitasatospora cheerisanensis KCTC 2395]|uniref:Uncharacterized protein n=1 Tax=Kitasatospora cheerisanensis KCTC 2395 TaxID=1348663 RepID=A0A066Z428_9ACTN|nr:hypothetical protein KCH_31950 [Kitasatospora cheerisanensis KCTC 2395]
MRPGGPGQIRRSRTGTGRDPTSPGLLVCAWPGQVRRVKRCRGSA